MHLFLLRPSLSWTTYDFDFLVVAFLNIGKFFRKNEELESLIANELTDDSGSIQTVGHRSEDSTYLLAAKLGISSPVAIRLTRKL